MQLSGMADCATANDTFYQLQPPHPRTVFLFYFRCWPWTVGGHQVFGFAKAAVGPRLLRSSELEDELAGRKELLKVLLPQDFDLWLASDIFLMSPPSLSVLCLVSPPFSSSSPPPDQCV